MRSIKAFAPATVANVCCGFDVLGFAVDAPEDEVIVTLVEEPGVVVKSIRGDEGRLPLEPTKNTASVAVLSFLHSQGHHGGAEIELIKKLPLGSGMGSSAASAAAALVAINQLLGSPLSRTELIPHAMEAERVACGSAHADNVAPSLLGGCVLIKDYHPLDIVQIPVAAQLFCTLIHPMMEIKTEDSRRVLKPVVRLQDAIAQAGNIAGLMVGLMQPDYSLIGRSLKDVLVEPSRSVFIPGFEECKKVMIEAGALGCGISGSGPTMFALSADEQSSHRAGASAKLHFVNCGLASEVHHSKINLTGARTENLLP